MILLSIKLDEFHGIYYDFRAFMIPLMKSVKNIISAIYYDLNIS